MKTSPRGIALIKEFEGLYLKTYGDRGGMSGVLTIGYGHTSAAGPPTVRPGMTVTAQEANDILAADLGRVEDDVTRLVTVPISQNQFDALVSFHFNTGGLGRSTALRYVNAGRFGDVPGALAMWDKASGKVMPGLTRRRKAEGDLFKSTVRTDTPLPDVEKPAPPIQHDPIPQEQVNWLVLLLRAIVAIFRRK